MRGRPSERVLFVSEHFLDHPKVRQLTDSEFRSWMLVLLGQLRNDDSDLPGYAYGISRRRLERFVDLELLDRDEGVLRVHGWDEWNGREAYKRFLARQRKRRQRARETG